MFVCEKLKGAVELLVKEKSFKCIVKNEWFDGEMKRKNKVDAYIKANILRKRRIQISQTHNCT